MSLVWIWLHFTVFAAIFNLALIMLLVPDPALYIYIYIYIYIYMIMIYGKIELMLFTTKQKRTFIDDTPNVNVCGQPINQVKGVKMSGQPCLGLNI